jgi:hypothetical protein
MRSVEVLEPFAAAPGTAQALHARMKCFVQAMAAGGPREEYEEWKASRDALFAALEIIGEPAESAGTAAGSAKHVNGAAQT